MIFFFQFFIYSYDVVQKSCGNSIFIQPMQPCEAPKYDQINYVMGFQKNVLNCIIFRLFLVQKVIDKCGKDLQESRETGH
jgi:hypothetical protein